MQFYNILLVLFLSVPFFLGGQNPSEELQKYGETELLILPARNVVKQLIPLNGIHIDHGANRSNLKVIVNKLGYDYLLEKGIAFEHLPRPNVKLRTVGLDELKQLKVRGECLPLIDFYPSYPAYLDMMIHFQESYPGLCEIIEIGMLSSGRKILVARLGTELKSEESKPGFLYTSTMHGNELVGYPLMLQLIDYLLCNYGMDDQVNYLMDNINIYINPLANPDGTYRGGDSIVSESTRYNSNFVDLNRNFPDPKAGSNPDGRLTQEETKIFMDFADNYRINMSCNIHSGVEVVNYPWDTYQELHSDNDWFVRVSRDYADMVQSNSTNDYFTALDNGITNGYDWYEVEGGRQDYHTYFKRAREIVLELSDTKLLDAALLPEYWNYNKQALLNYMEESTFNLNGEVRDCLTGEAIEAEIYIDGHDNKQSSVFSDSLSGRYFRYLAEASYELTVRADNYQSQYHLVDVVDKSSIVANFELCPDDIMSSIDNFDLSLSALTVGNKILLNGTIPVFDIKYGIYDMMGQNLQSGHVIDMSINLESNLPQGIYNLVLYNQQQMRAFRFIRLH